MICVHTNVFINKNKKGQQKTSKKSKHANQKYQTEKPSECTDISQSTGYFQYFAVLSKEKERQTFEKT